MRQFTSSRVLPHPPKRMKAAPDHPVRVMRRPGRRGELAIVDSTTNPSARHWRFPGRRAMHGGGSRCCSPPARPASWSPPFRRFSSWWGPVADGVVFFVGSLLFTSAAALQWRQTIHAGRSDRIDRWSSGVQLLGTLFFNATTFRALQTGLDSPSYDRLVWRPDFFGSICFLISGYLAYVEINGLPLGRPRRTLDSAIARVNLLGCLAFGVSAVTAFVVPSTGSEISLAMVNLCTSLGALCFLVGALLLLPQGAQDGEHLGQVRAEQGQVGRAEPVGGGLGLMPVGYSSGGRLTSSRRVSSSVVSDRSAAPRLSASRSVVRAPMITEVTAGRSSSQASATCAGDAPRSLATSTRTSTMSYSLSWSSTGGSSQPDSSRDCSGPGSPRRYLPLSSPPASGPRPAAPGPGRWRPALARTRPRGPGGCSGSAG